VQVAPPDWQILSLAQMYEICRRITLINYPSAESDGATSIVGRQQPAESSPSRYLNANRPPDNNYLDSRHLDDCWSYLSDGLQHSVC
jgi:hypothetical protein